MATAYNVEIESVAVNPFAFMAAFKPVVTKKVDGTATETYHIDTMLYAANCVSHGVAIIDSLGIMIPDTDPVGSGNIELLFKCGSTTYKATVAPATLKAYTKGQSITVTAVS